MELACSTEALARAMYDASSSNPYGDQADRQWTKARGYWIYTAQRVESMLKDAECSPDDEPKPRSALAWYIAELTDERDAALADLARARQETNEADR